MATIDATLRHALEVTGGDLILTLDPALQGLPETAHGGSVLAVFDALAGATRPPGPRRPPRPLSPPCPARSAVDTEASPRGLGRDLRAMRPERWRPGRRARGPRRAAQPLPARRERRRAPSAADLAHVLRLRDR